MENLEKKVFRYFGKEGLNWLKEIPRIQQECIKLWDLKDVSESEIMSANYISFCKSNLFGEVVLKIGFPHPDLFSEMEALQVFKGKRIVRLLDFNRELGALLLERIKPGDNLTTIKERGDRIKIAAEICGDLPIPWEKRGEIPRLRDLAEKAFTNLHKEGIAGEKVKGLVNSARERFREISEGMPDFLLHGDLNHWNILKNIREWKAIDPKGYRGPAFMETGRFMINELNMTPPAEKTECLEEMVNIFSKILGQTNTSISRAAFIDKALSLTWKFEEYNRGNLFPDIADLELLAKFNQIQEEKEG